MPRPAPAVNRRFPVVPPPFLPATRPLYLAMFYSHRHLPSRQHPDRETCPFRQVYCPEPHVRAFRTGARLAVVRPLGLVALLALTLAASASAAEPPPNDPA